MYIIYIYIYTVYISIVEEKQTFFFPTSIDSSPVLGHGLAGHLRLGVHLGDDSTVAIGGSIGSVANMGVEPKIGGKPPQIIHLFIGFSIIFTIHFGGFPYFRILQISTFQSNPALCFDILRSFFR